MPKLKKIYVYFRGGLGNQLFQYSKALSIKKKYGGMIIALRNIHNPLNTYRPFRLNKLNLDIKFSIYEMLKFYFSSKFNRNIQFINEAKDFVYTDIKVLKNNILLNGYWQTFKSAECSFNEIKKKIFMNILLEKNFKKYLFDIKKSNSLAIHIRRGDYVKNKIANKFHGLLPKEYFFKSIEFIKKQHPDIKVFIFSDDIEWCKKNFLESRATFIIAEDMNNSDLKELYLMSFCKHFIISNSSFGWWGAVLSNHNSKIIISPKKWLNFKVDTSDLIPNNWIQL